MIKKERWAIVTDYPDYAVSDTGKVKRVIPNAKGRLSKVCLKATVTSKGYEQIGLWKNGKQKSAMVHRIVCAAFNGPQPTPRHIVAHFDGNPLNNNYKNVRWATYFENEQDKKRHGTGAIGEKQGASKLTRKDIISIRKDKRSQRKIAADYGVTQANIYFIVNRISWKHIL